MIQEFVRKRYGKEARIEKLAGDASERKFYRIRTADGSLILMQCESPFKEDELPFINIWKFLTRNHFAVPVVHTVYPEDGVIVMSDLGDNLLQYEIQYLLKKKDKKEVRILCEKAMETIVDLQTKGTAALDDTCVASQYALDKDRFIFELEFFYEHYVRGLLMIRLTEWQEKELKSWFEGLAGEVSGFGNVLCHRDFHSRNLVIVNGELHMTDFQDSRLGPYTYDLASFLRDSYVLYDEDLVDEMLETYRVLLRAKLSRRAELQEILEGRLPDFLINGEPGRSRDRFRREFDLTCIQRNIKAIGTFAFQWKTRKNSFYLQFIPSTLNRITMNLRRLSKSNATLDLILSRDMNDPQHDQTRGKKT